MAQRFGGQYSPDGTGAQAQAAPIFIPQKIKGMKRVKILFLLSPLFALKAFWHSAGGMGLGFAALGLMLAGAFLTREGLRAEYAYDRRRIAKRPALPRKILGALCMGAALTVGGMIEEPSFSPIIYGIVGFVLHYLSFGPDPLKNKGAEGIDEFQSGRVARAVDEAEGYLTAMLDTVTRTKNRALQTKVEHFAVTARQLFRTVENDPRDLTAVRKYLTVYMMGARDATVKFVDLYSQNHDAKAKQDYETLVAELETTFENRNKMLLENDADALNVEMQVLRERLHYETPKS